MNTTKMAGEGDKRDRDRVPTGGQLEGEVMVFQPMTIVDISHDGAQVETQFALQVDSLHDFRLSLGDRSVVVKARIAHCHVEELRTDLAVYHSGIEFVEPSEHVRLAVADFVDALRELRRAPVVVDGEITESDNDVG